MEQRLKDKVVIVTGGAGLIGRAFIRAIAQNGGTAIIADIDVKQRKHVLSEIRTSTGTECIVFFKLDINSRPSILNLMKHVTRRFGRIDALVNSAYPRNKNFGRNFEEVTYKDFCKHLNVHLGGYFLVSQQVAFKMMQQKFGNIINIASIYGFVPPRFELYEGTKMTVEVEYATVKAGIIQMTKFLAKYLSKYNIRANCISPGGVFDNQPKAFLQRYNRMVPLGNRMANTGDLTGPLVFLLSDESKYITGQNIIVDGGWSL